VAWIEQTLRSGDVLYDVGANVGAYALIAAHWTDGRSTVYAFEPGYTTFPDLVANIFLNGRAETVIPFPVALGAETGLTPFEYATLEPGGAAHGGLAEAGSAAPVLRTQTVPAYRLDDLVALLHLRSPTHVKLDVDGAEWWVLQGAAETLAASTLRWILVEVDSAGSQAGRIRDLLERYDFVLDSDHPHAGGTTHNWIFRKKGVRPCGGS
jgi:FkbM family methyltransferase